MDEKTVVLSSGVTALVVWHSGASTCFGGQHRNIFVWLGG